MEEVSTKRLETYQIRHADATSPVHTLRPRIEGDGLRLRIGPVVARFDSIFKPWKDLVPTPISANQVLEFARRGRLSDR